MNDPKSPLLKVRWLVLVTALATAISLILDMATGSGTWRLIALVMAAITAGIVVLLVSMTRNYERTVIEAAEIAARSEHERAELQRELERRNQLEHQLRQAKQDAESAVMAKGEFLATMSHEIRTPLNGIVPMLDLLMSNKLPADQAEMVHTAFLSSQQMLRIVDDILDYSKLEASKLQLESTAFNLRETLEAVMQLMERPAQSKGLRLNLQIDPSVRLPVRGDPVRLRQVLSNLISNAVKFTERGNVSVSVRRIGETNAQHQLRFEVRDTGIGIPTAAQERLFQAFSQADASTTRLYGGTGLGLAISKRIIDLMGGRIGVQSEPGQGSTFWFEIPMLKVQGDITASRPAEATEGRVLLITSDQRLRLRLSMLLPNWGLRLTSVETTQEALDRLRASATQGPPWAYTLVIADLATIRNTAVSLQRNLERQNTYGDLRLVCLQGDEQAPDELVRNASILPRQSPDADLRTILLGTGVDSLSTTPEPIADAAYSAQQAEDAAMAEVQPAPAEPEAPARQLRVLLVEDNPVNLMVGQRLLSVLGTHCDTATNGEAALLRMTASRYDLVLMDCQMPVMDGYTATRRWREHEAASGNGRRLPIVAMTANAMAGDRQKCLDAGMDDYLAKPVTRGELERCLFHWQQVSSQFSHSSYKPEDVANAIDEIPTGKFRAVEAEEPEYITPASITPALITPAPPPAAAPVAAPPVIAMPEVARPAPVLPESMPPATAPAPPVATPMPHPAPAPAPIVEPAVAMPPPAPVAPPVAAPPVPPPVAPAPAVASLAPRPAAAPMPPATPPPAPMPPATSMPSTPSSAPAAPAKPQEPPAPVLDRLVLEELRSILGGEVDRLIEVFLDDTPRLVAALETAAVSQDFDMLRNVAHTLKSSSANLGAMSLSNAAKRVELGARTRTLERPAVAVALIANEFARARQALRATMASAPGTSPTP